MATRCHLIIQVDILSFELERQVLKFSRLITMLSLYGFCLHIFPQQARSIHDDEGGDYYHPFPFRSRDSWFLTRINIRIISYFSEFATRFPNDTPWLH